MKFVCSLIVVSDIKKSRAFYENLLNQRIKFDFGENVTYYGDFAIHSKKHFKGLIDNKGIIKGANDFELYFEYDDLEEIVEKLKKNKVSFVHDLREQPWRQKVVRLYDPDGHLIEIGESMEHLFLRLHKEGLSLAEISKSTSFPEELIKTALEK